MKNILERMANKKYCRKNPDMETKKEILDKIIMFEKEKKPLRFVVLFGGYKNPHLGEKEPALSEVLTIKRLADYIKKVGNFYPYGTELFVVTTGRKGEIANGITSDLTNLYENKIKRISENNFCNIKVVPIGNLYGISKIIDQVRAISNNRSNGNAENIKIEKLKIAMRHNIEEISEQEAIRNANTYAALTEIEPIALNEYFGNHIKLSFRQNVEAGAISMFTCKKGMVKQPWNGTCDGCRHANHCQSHITSGKIMYT